MNVNFLRLGPKKLWDWIDARLPTKSCCSHQIAAGKAFAENRLSGLPFIFLPSVIFIFIFLIENKLVNRINKSRVIKKRCIGCGACIAFCPSQRLKMVNGYPKSKGTCALCFGCLNICPKNAMRLTFVSIPFDNIYRPKFGDFVVKSKKSAAKPA
jgi:ferredoxin